MKSYLVLGDVGVYALDGLNIESRFDDDSISRHRSPRLYEGAAMAGIALEQAIGELRLPIAPKVCRYLTPLEPYLAPSGLKGQVYPLVEFHNFRDSRNPMGQPSLVWTVAPTRLHGDAREGQQLRLKEERRKAPHPYGVHSRLQLESLRPGGLFEHSPSYTRLLATYRTLRDLFIAMSIVRGLPTNSELNTDALASQLRSEFKRVISEAEPPSIDELCREFGVRASGDGRRTLATDVINKWEESKAWLSDKQRQNQLATLFKGLSPSKFNAGLESLFEALHSLAELHRGDAAFPDVLILYDMFQRVRIDDEDLLVDGGHRVPGAYRNGLRTTPLSVNADQTTPYKFVYDGRADRSGSTGPVEVAKADDLLLVSKAWIAQSFGNLVRTARETAANLLGQVRKQTFAYDSTEAMTIVNEEFIKNVLAPFVG